MTDKSKAKKASTKKATRKAVVRKVAGKGAAKKASAKKSASKNAEASASEVTSSSGALPTVSHLRRAAEAVAGKADDKNHWVAIDLASAPPYAVEVSDTAANARAARKRRQLAKGANWGVIPCRSEKPEAIHLPTNQVGFFFVDHGEYSPMGLATDMSINREDIIGFELVVITKVKGRDEVRTAVTLPEEDIRGQKVGLPDAIFLSFEAMDKYLFPNLSGVYGVNGANQLREELAEQIVKRFSPQTASKDWKFRLT
ncbi:MAG: hypothetical protein ABJB66_11350 [Gemmatimonadaceae bacterium]